MIQHVIPVWFLRDGIQARVEMVQGDSGREIHFVPEDISLKSDMAAKIYVEKPSGLASYRNAEIHDNAVVVKVTTQMLAEAGVSLGQVQLYQGDVKVTSFLFRLEVKKSIVDASGIESKDEFTILEQTIKEALAAINAANAAIEAAAQATRKAEDAAEAANASSQKAETAAGTAVTAATNAATATGNANTAAELATTEAGNAETAAANANEVYERLKNVDIAQVSTDITNIKNVLQKTIIAEV